MGQPEYALHVAVADYLRAVLPPEVLFLHVPNGEHRSKITGARLKRMGVRPGVADLMIAWTERSWAPVPLPSTGIAHVLWIELKAARGRQSPEQLTFQRDAIFAGHNYQLCRSIAHVEMALNHFGVPMRGRIAA